MFLKFPEFEMRFCVVFLLVKRDCRIRRGKVPVESALGKFLKFSNDLRLLVTSKSN